MGVTTDSVSLAAPGPARRLVRRALGLVLAVAVPTAFIAWVLGFDAIKKQINGRLWCSDADQVIFDVRVTSSGATTYYNDRLVCRANGAVVRTVGDLRMMATNIGVAFVISLVLLGVLIAALWIYTRLRRRR